MFIPHLTSYLTHQRGAVFLLFTTVFLPLVLIGAALAINVSTIQVQKTQLQNAADAAALAGASQYGSATDTNTITSNINTYVRNYVEKNIVNATIGDTPNAVNFPDDTHTVNINITQGTQDTAKTVTVDLRRKVPLYFFGLHFLQDFTRINVAVRATAEYTSASTNSSTNPFGNAIYTSGKNADIHFNSNNIFVDGNLTTSGQITVDGTNSNNSLSGTITGSHEFGTHYSNTANNDSIWSKYDSAWNNKTKLSDVTYHELSKSTNGKTLSSLSTIDSNGNEVSDSYTKVTSSTYFTNEDTNAQNIVNNYIKSIVSTTGTSYINANTHVYYDPSGSFSGQCWTTDTGYTGLMSGSGWNPNAVYTIIIVDGDINAGMYNNKNSTAPNNVILISLHGNVIFNNSFTQQTVNGIIYAPNGLVSFMGSGQTEFSGSIVANAFTITNGNSIIKYNSNSFSGSTGESSNYSIRLIE